MLGTENFHYFKQCTSTPNKVLSTPYFEINVTFYGIAYITEFNVFIESRFYLFFLFVAVLYNVQDLISYRVVKYIIN